MKIGFLASYRAQKDNEKRYQTIIEYFQKKGYEVVHNMDMTVDDLLALEYPEREKIFVDFYKKLEKCDVVFAECSTQSTQVGYGFSYLRSKGVPIVVLTVKGAASPFMSKGDIYSNLENLIIVEYEDSTIPTALSDALDYMKEHIDKRFTIIFPPHLMAELEEVAGKKKLPKAVYIRQLLEEALKVEIAA